MACPSGGSPANLITRGTPIRHVLKHPEPSPETRDRTGARSWGRFRRSSTRSSPTTKPLRPSSGIPPRRSFGASATSTATAAVTPRCNAICASTAARHQETFIPLGHLPGQRLEADFGHIHVDFPDGRGSSRSWSPPGPTRTPPSSWHCPSSAPRPSSKAWSRPSSSSAPFPRKSGGTTPKRSPR